MNKLLLNKVFWLALLVAGGLEAQAPGLFPWWDSPIARDLNLSDEQTKQIRSTVVGFRPRMIQLRAAVEVAEAELQELMNEDAVDSRKATEAIEKVIAARGELTRAVSQMSLKLRMVLTSRQWQELQRRQPPVGHRPQGGPMPGRNSPGGSLPGRNSPGGSPRPEPGPRPPDSPPPPDQSELLQGLLEDAMQVEATVGQAIGVNLLERPPQPSGPFGPR